MSKAKPCLKCGKSTPYEGAEPEACAHCGAIYRKVEEALRNGPISRPMDSVTLPPARPRYATLDHVEFAHVMRAESIYPTFRAVVNILYWVGVVLAVLSLISGIWITLRTHSGPGPALGGLLAAVLIYIVFRVTKEMSLMLADLSDATLRTAAHKEAAGARQFSVRAN